MRPATKATASIGVCTVLYRYKNLKNGGFSKTVHFTKTIWVRCNEDEWHDISNAGGLHEMLSREAESWARRKWPKERGWVVSASESWAVNPKK